ncbi:phage tail protein, partial [Hyphomonas sp.]|uniref:TipJ family phage tail tip protein n=1 Tax=Hyphomonas sp. TaxID=87 RepID=UPI0025C0ECF6
MTEDKKKIIRGAGGGPPPPPPPPTRTPDTLHSKQFATIQDLISEGEIEGFATASKEGRTKNTSTYNNAALKDVFLNKTPVLKSSANSANPHTSDFNHLDVTFVPRFGTSNQSFVPGIQTSSSPTGVGVTVTTSSPVTRQITNTNVDAIKVTLTWPQIQVVTTEGDVLGSTVNYKIQIQYNSGGFSDVIDTSVTGRSADAYQRDHRVNINGSFPVDIRVVRVTADPSDSNTRNEFQFTTITEIIDNRSPYLNSAYAHLRLDSQKFSSIPQRMYRIRGIKVRIPAANGGLTPTIDLQTGRINYPTNYVFNGTMGAAVYTNCPAMILLDLLTNTRYGLGSHITDSNLDLFSFVAASRYANELVDDGQGGQEARFSCNVNIQSEKEAFDVINDLSSVMKCMPIWSAGAITITQDKPTDASYLFNLSNIASSGFSYTGSSLKQRHSVIRVSYFNMDSHEVDYEVVEDSTAISKYGVSIKQVKAFGCTSRNQAARLGRSILFAEQ